MNKAQWKMVEELRVENKQLRDAMYEADQRLLDASDKIGFAPMGCDTADLLADEILGLRSKLAAALRDRDTRCTSALNEAKQVRELSTKHAQLEPELADC